MGHDLAEHGARPLAHIAFTADEEDATVFVDLDDQRRSIPVAYGAVAAHMHGRRHAHAATLDATDLGALAFAGPTYSLGCHVYAFPKPGAADMPAVNRDITGLERVDLVHLHRVQAQFLRHGVDMAVERKLHLGSAKAPEGTAWRIVGVVQRCFRTHIGIAVHVVAAHGTDVHHITGKACICTAFGNDANLLGDNAAVLEHAQLEGDALGHAGTCGLEVLQAVVDQPHRTSGMQSQQAGKQLVVVLHDLAAEATSGRGLNHAHAENGQTKGHGHLHAHQIHCLG